MNLQIDSSDFRGIENPEKKLLYALLRRAVLDFFGTDGVLREEARQWFFAPGRKMQPDAYSFRWICQQLDIEVDVFIKQLKEGPAASIKDSLN